MLLDRTLTCLPLPACLHAGNQGYPKPTLNPPGWQDMGSGVCSAECPRPHAQGTAPTTWLCGLGKTFTLSASESVKREHELNKIRVYVLSIYSVPGIPGLCGVGYVCPVTSTGPGCEPTPFKEILLVQISDPSFYPLPMTECPPPLPAAFIFAPDTFIRSSSFLNT